MNNHSNPDFDKPTTVPVPPELDTAKYAPYVEDFDMTDDQKGELLATLWTIMQTFVNLGFDVAKADVCGQLFADFSEAAALGQDDVESGHASTRETISGKDSA